jgi:hypothetical protein
MDLTFMHRTFLSTIVSLDFTLFSAMPYFVSVYLMLSFLLDFAPLSVSLVS